MVASLSAEASAEAEPRHRKAVCVSTAGEAEERRAIAAKTGHRDLRAMRRQTKNGGKLVCQDFLKFGGDAARKRA